MDSISQPASASARRSQTGRELTKLRESMLTSSRVSLTTSDMAALDFETGYTTDNSIACGYKAKPIQPIAGTLADRGARIIPTARVTMMLTVAAREQCWAISVRASCSTSCPSERSNRVDRKNRVQRRSGGAPPPPRAERGESGDHQQDCGRDRHRVGRDHRREERAVGARGINAVVADGIAVAVDRDD